MGTLAPLGCDLMRGSILGHAFRGRSLITLMTGTKLPCIHTDLAYQLLGRILGVLC